jgi:hypothetical protein
LALKIPFFCQTRDESGLEGSGVGDGVCELRASGIQAPGWVLWYICPQDHQKIWVPVAHAYNPSYSSGRDQEDQGLKPAWANSLQDPIFKKTHHKKGLGQLAQGDSSDIVPA